MKNHLITTNDVWTTLTGGNPYPKLPVTTPDKLMLQQKVNELFFEYERDGTAVAGLIMGRVVEVVGASVVMRFNSLGIDWIPR